MAEVRFSGEIPGSKSLFNRALIVQSYFPALELLGHSECDDVRHMREGLKYLCSRSHIDCGEGGTTFRFMALRVSRLQGRHTLEATPRLLQRPQKGLLSLLNQLGVQTQIKGRELLVITDGWHKPKAPLKVDTSESSQYASALILNSWLLDFDLEFELVGEKVSESYFSMTLQMLRDFGLCYRVQGNHYVIPAGQRISKLSFRIESDLSSAFTMAAAGAMVGGTRLVNYPFHSTQPDGVFVEIFRKMQIPVETQGNDLLVGPTPSLQAVDWDLFQSPDLFPVLAVLCSWALGTSKLHNAPQLAAKESNRIARVADLFRLLEISHEVLSDGMIIHGHAQQPLKKSVVFNPDQDHRMVMAATLMKLKGHDIRIEHPEAINKSFPEFWDMIGIKP